jgi:phytanoyl-CoA hydroxylase
MMLSDAQLQQFNQNGFLVLKKFLNEKNCNAILDVAKEHLVNKIEPIETEIAYNENSKKYRTNHVDYMSQAQNDTMVVRRLRQVYGRDKLFKQWMEDADIRPLLQQILEDKVVITTGHHNSIMTKMPHVSTETQWHQDRRYWRYSDDNLVSVWLALDDEDNQNGVLEFIPGSHKMNFDADQFDEKEYFSQSNEANKNLIATKVSSDLQKGDVVLFHSLLLHRANKNTTNKEKISFVYTVKGSKTRAQTGTRSAEFPEIALEFI